MSEQISIVKRRCCWVVVPGRETRSTLWFYAPGLEVYVRGDGAARQFDTMANIAMNEAVSRHIPANSLKTVPSRENSYGGQQPPAGKPKQKPLPFDEDDSTLEDN